ncbi:MAG TPA: hypothetical protein VMW23_02775 [Sedimentisphaerales bacterium]|nr:hypothetical protein [Sedimentisphaerales bacterium]
MAGRTWDLRLPRVAPAMRKPAIKMAGLNMFGLRIRPALSEGERVRNDRDEVAAGGG